jgi:hypothetical protein
MNNYSEISQIVSALGWIEDEETPIPMVLFIKSLWKWHNILVSPIWRQNPHTYIYWMGQNLLVPYLGKNNPITNIVFFWHILSPIIYLNHNSHIWRQQADYNWIMIWWTVTTGFLYSFFLNPQTNFQIHQYSNVCYSISTTIIFGDNSPTIS